MLEVASVSLERALGKVRPCCGLPPKQVCGTELKALCRVQKQRAKVPVLADFCSTLFAKNMLMARL